MLKRDIALLIAGGLLSGQIAWAAADQGSFPYSVTETYSAPPPATMQYLQQRAADNAKLTGAIRPVFPSAPASSGGGVTTPDRLAYWAQRAKTISTDPATIKVGTSTQYINVEHLQKVKIENDKGQSFVWQADTLTTGQDNFPLQAVAPKDFAAGATRVYLTHPHEHMLHN